MFLDWILFAYPETAGKAELLPTALLWEMYEGVAPGGEDWDTLTCLVQFIHEAELDKTKARRVLDLVMEYSDSSAQMYFTPKTPFNGALTSQHPPYNPLKGNLIKVFKGNYVYSDLAATIWYIARQIMIVRNPDTRAALTKKIEAL